MCDRGLLWGSLAGNVYVIESAVVYQVTDAMPFILVALSMIADHSLTMHLDTITLYNLKGCVFLIVSYVLEIVVLILGHVFVFTDHSCYSMVAVFVAVFCSLFIPVPYLRRLDGGDQC